MTELLGGLPATQTNQVSVACRSSQGTLERTVEAADAAAEKATAAAADARARANLLHRQAQATDAERRDAEEVCTTRSGTDRQAGDDELDNAPLQEAVGPSSDAASERRRRWPGFVCVALVVLLIGGAGAAGYHMVWEHRVAVRDRQLTAEFVAAARQEVVTLMSMNFQDAKQDVQRVVDNSTGEFRDDFARAADDFTKMVEDSKAVMTTKVTGAAVQSMTAGSGIVLITATSDVTNSAGVHQDPRTWRLIVTLARDGGTLKMSRVEFV
jgi:Mce-associated membrane protein